MSILIIQADARSIPLADKSVHCVVTSPPYWGLRDYGVAGQLGLEKTPEEYIAQMVEVFREVKRVLRDDGTIWVNMGDSYQGGNRGEYGKTRGGNGIQQTNPGSDTIGAPNRFPIPGLKAKDLVGIPWMLAFALRADGWYLRSDIIWSKPNPMPESVSDRPTKAHEYIFLLSKNERYYYDVDAILEPVSENTHMRLSQNLARQVGSHRANGGGKTNGPMKAVGRKAKQDETGNRRYTGFNERWKVKHNASFDASVCLPVTERNKRSVWTVNAQGFAEAHFATFPEELIKPCILAGCPAGGIVLDPFMGSGTTALVARNLQCNAVGLELNAAYIEIAKRRLAQEVLDFK
jgi:DNA modification methylase